MTDRMFFVYVHRKADDGTVFYVGKGTIKHGKPERAHEQYGRTKWWGNVVRKHGVSVEIVKYFHTEHSAHEYERKLISQYGRESLVNLTDGGEGCHGIVPSKSTRDKLSVLASRPRTEAWVRSIRIARKNGGNGGVVKHGDKLPAAWKNSIAIGKLGPLNPMYGRTGAKHPRSRPVVHILTGIFYDSVQEAADVFGYKMKTLYNRLSRCNPNLTPLRFA